MASGIIKLFHYDRLIDTRIFQKSCQRRDIIANWIKVYKLANKEGCYFDIELTGDIKLPKVINTDTKQTFSTIKEAAKSIGMNYSTLHRKLIVPRINETPLRFISKFSYSPINHSIKVDVQDYFDKHIYITS